MKKKELEQAVTRLMLNLGFPAHLDGFNYLRYGIMMYIEEPGVVRPITRKLYPALARIYHTKATRIEHSIRHAIEVAWNRGNYDLQVEYFGYSTNPTSGRPSNMDFIIRAGDIIKLELDYDEV